MASLEDSCDSIYKFIEEQLDLFEVQLKSMQKACESIVSSIKRRLEEFKQEHQNAHFTTLQVNTVDLEAEFRNDFKEYHNTTINALRIEVLEEIRSLRKDLLGVKSSDSVRDDATYSMSPESEELEDEPRRKKSRSKLIVDRVKHLNNNYMRARIANKRVELRCESAAHERIVIRTPASTLLTSPAHGGPTSPALGGLFAERLSSVAANAGRPPAGDRPVEEVLFQSPVQNQVEEIQAETPVDKTMQELTIQDLTIQEQGVQDQVMEEISNRDISVRNVQVTEAAARDSMDIADLPTQKPITTSQKKRAGENEKTPRKSRSQLPSLDRSAEVPPIVLSPNEVAQQSNVEHLISTVQEAALVDFQLSPAPAGIEPATLTQHERRTHGSEDSETPLGSLDRTNVSLGESETTTNSMRIIDEEWGVKGTMHKIFHCVMQGVPQITVERLVFMGSAKESPRRIIVEHCFKSILKLRNNGFIKVTKDNETNSIKHIELGPRITKGRSSLLLPSHSVYKKLNLVQGDIS